MTPLWRYLVQRADAWLTSYICRAVPAAHHIGQAVGPDRVGEQMYATTAWKCCDCCGDGGCSVVHRDACDRHQVATS